jgi:hypothetical protein
MTTLVSCIVSARFGCHGTDEIVHFDRFVGPTKQRLIEFVTSGMCFRCQEDVFERIDAQGGIPGKVIHPNRKGVK